MNETKFKNGDLVYIFGANKIGKITELLSVNTIKIHNQKEYFHPSRLCHATQENYERLSATFTNIEFEPPPKRKEPKEVIKAMLESGKWYLVNYRGYGKIGNPPKNKTVTKEQFEKLDMNGYFDKNAYANVEVFCPNTGKTIIDFIDGEVILENENE